MPTKDGHRLPPTVKSTVKDGLDASGRAGPRHVGEEFARVFGVASLDHVALVGPSFLEKAPKGCQWYVRFRPAPANPGLKDRKRDSYELVVKAPQRAAPEAGNEIAVNPKRTGLRAKDPDAARLEAVILLARKSGRSRRATNWPIEMIQGLLVCDVLDTYVDVFMIDPSEDKKKKYVPHTRDSYRLGIRAFQKAFPPLARGWRRR